MKTLEVVLELIRIALGYQQNCSLSEPVDWKDVLKLSEGQGVAPLVCDGLCALYDKNPNCAAALALNGNSSLRHALLSSAVVNEGVYLKMQSAIENMSVMLDENGVKMMVLKGYSVGLIYPNPYRRSCGDIDVYLFGCGEKADDLFKSKGFVVKQNEDKHSSFTFDDFCVENHASFLNIVEHPSLKEEESILENECEKSECVRVGNGRIYIPSILHNALFLSSHIACHFVNTGATLKQITDWAVFVNNYGREIDWAEVFRIASRAGYCSILHCLNALAIHKYNVPADCVPVPLCTVEFEDKFLEEIVYPAYGAEGNVLFKVRRFFCSQWKYRLVYKDNPVTVFFRRGWAQIRGRYFENSRSVWH